MTINSNCCRGYMAPEYVVRGKLTEKVDVYSFGVLLIEVVSGKGKNPVPRDSRSLLQMVWSLHGNGRLCEAVDPVLEGDFQEDEASRLLHIGLLCVQASPELRPSMSKVVKMIKGEPRNSSANTTTVSQPCYYGDQHG
ncbi:hypothetical protein OIU84_018595 [Salix udensis]|uniref:Protein kinase domain-containing protein n=1 Tax=Salix udensis TaxID=889485 RepID=A0AAD6KY80_9ROSI|nr:hypothetical protein OIU84_018595 [Salix udensis]